MSFTAGNDVNILQETDMPIVGAGAGDDVYIVDSYFLDNNQHITISDDEGNNVIHLVGGLEIKDVNVAQNAIEFVLSNGATIDVLDADNFNFLTGGDSLTGEGGLNQTFNDFVTNTLGLTIPEAGEVNSENNVIINYGGGLTKECDLQSMLFVKALDSGVHWDSNEVTFSFNTAPLSDYGQLAEDSGVSPQEFLNTFSPLNTSEQNYAKDVLHQIEDISNLKFIQVSDNGEIRFNMFDLSVLGSSDVAGEAFYPGDGLGGDVLLDNDLRTDPNMRIEKGQYGYLVLLHEIGHAIGLKHPFEGNYTLPTDKDSDLYTVMSYTDFKQYIPFLSYDNNYIYFETKGAYPATYQPYDIATIQSIYGVNLNYNEGDDVYKFDSSYDYYSTIWDSGGSDTIDCSSITRPCYIDLEPGSFSTIGYESVQDQENYWIGWLHKNDIYDNDDWVRDNFESIKDNIYTGENNLAIAFGTIIENVKTGSSNDIIHDNSANNIISTGDGDDIIYLDKGGIDKIDGGNGFDTVVFPFDSNSASIHMDNYADVVDYNNGEAFLVGVEQLDFTDKTIDLS